VVFVQQNLTDPVQRVAKAGGGLAEVEFLQYDQSLRHAAGIQWALGKGYAVLLFSEAIFADGRAMSVLMPDGVHPSTTATDEILVPILDSHWMENW